MTTSILAITLLVLRCRDIERSRVFYENLGLQCVAEKHGPGPKHYSTTIGTLVLELYPQTDAETRGLRIGFIVADLRTTLLALENSGATPVRVKLDASPPTALVHDPDGHQVELTQRTETVA